MLESLNAWRKPYTLTFFLDLEETCETSTAAAAIREFEKQLKESTHPAKELIHFLRMFLLPDSEKNYEQIVLSVVFDGNKLDFLNLLVDGFKDALLEVLKNVAGGSELHASQSDADLVSWLMSQNLDPATYHVGTVWNSVTEIRNDRKVYLEISSFLDSRDDLDQLAPQEIKKRITEGVQNRLPQGVSTVEAPSWRSLKLLDAALFILAILLMPSLTAILIVVVLKWAILSLLWLIPVIALTIVLGLGAFIRCLEFMEEDHQMWPDDSHLKNVVANENTGVQNQISLVVDVKSSRARRGVITAVLWIADAVSRHWYTRGRLTGIDTIHFARFFLLKGKRRMLFMSDYDGSWSRYLFDFTGPGSLAVVPIWSSLRGCPKARFLRWPTVGFEERFLPFTRCCQFEVQCWYSGYPQLTVSEIKRNEKIRLGLFKQSSDQEILDWLSLFGGGAGG